MNDREREQLNLIARHELGITTRTLEERIQMIFADHSAKGRLHSGATIKVAIGAMGELVDAFLANLSLKVKAVTVEPEAFETLSATVGKFLDICLERQMPPITRMASGRMQGPRDEGVQRAAQELFDQMKADTDAKLAIAAFDFDARKASMPVAPPIIITASLPRKGGRPPAEFWDDMWAAIATKLYDGTLTPKTQADVERAMADWIELRGHSAADSTVRGRARRLWDSLSAIDV